MVFLPVGSSASASATRQRNTPESARTSAAASPAAPHSPSPPSVPLSLSLSPVRITAVGQSSSSAREREKERLSDQNKLNKTTNKGKTKDKEKGKMEKEKEKNKEYQNNPKETVKNGAAAAGQISGQSQSQSPIAAQAKSNNESAAGSPIPSPNPVPSSRPFSGSSDYSDDGDGDASDLDDVEEKKVSELDEDAESKQPEPMSPLELDRRAVYLSEEEVETERYRIFIHWMRTHGARFPNLTLQRYSKNYRGVHIKSKEQDIKKGKILLKIPLKMLITVELAKSSPIGKLVATLPNIGSQAILAVYLLQEKQKGYDSFWKPWFDVLPTSFRNLPMFFSASELTWLKGSNELLLKVKSQQKSMRDEYNAIQKLNPPIQFSYEDFVWSCLAVGTRVFSLCINGGKTSVLAPLADMMNHKNPSGTNWSFDNKKQSFVLTACTALFDGDAVHESYGVKDNKRFFASYGFCLEDNPANEVSVCIKGDLVIDSSSVRHFTVRGAYDNLAEELMGYLRIANAYEYQLQAMLQQDGARFGGYGGEAAPFSHYAHAFATALHPPASAMLRGLGGPISVDNELSALYALRCACKDHLRGYDTTLEEDQKLLASPDVGQHPDNGNIRNCLIFRIGEKKIYQFFIDWSTTAISLLCMQWEEARGKIKQLLDPNSPDCCVQSGMITYISTVIAPLLQERHHQQLSRKRLMQRINAPDSPTHPGSSASASTSSGPIRFPPTLQPLHSPFSGSAMERDRDSSPLFPSSAAQGSALYSIPVNSTRHSGVHYAIQYPFHYTSSGLASILFDHDMSGYPSPFHHPLAARFFIADQDFEGDQDLDQEHEHEHEHDADDQDRGEDGEVDTGEHDHEHDPNDGLYGDFVSADARFDVDLMALRMRRHVDLSDEEDSDPLAQATAADQAMYNAVLGGAAMDFSGPASELPASSGRRSAGQVDTDGSASEPQSEDDTNLSEGEMSSKSQFRHSAPADPEFQFYAKHAPPFERSASERAFSSQQVHFSQGNHETQQQPLPAAEDSSPVLATGSPSKPAAPILPPLTKLNGSLNSSSPPSAQPASARDRSSTSSVQRSQPVPRAPTRPLPAVSSSPKKLSSNSRSDGGVRLPSVNSVGQSGSPVKLSPALSGSQTHRPSHSSSLSSNSQSRSRSYSHSQNATVSPLKLAATDSGLSRTVERKRLSGGAPSQLPSQSITQSSPVKPHRIPYTNASPVKGRQVTHSSSPLKGPIAPHPPLEPLPALGDLPGLSPPKAVDSDSAVDSSPASESYPASAVSVAAS